MIGKKKHILIAIPAVGHSLCTHLAAYATKLIQDSKARGFPYKFSVAYLVDVRPTEYARNILVTTALSRKDCDAIWFWDADMIPSANSLQLLEVEADIAVGMAPIFSNVKLDEPSFCYNIYENAHNKGKNSREFMPVLPGVSRKVFRVDGAGCSCMIIYRHVLEDKKLWLQDKKVKNGDGRPIVPYFRWPRSIIGETKATDDLDFCKRLRKTKYRIMCDPQVVWGHQKMVDLEWIINKVAVTYQATKNKTMSPFTTNEQNKKAKAHNKKVLAARKKKKLKKSNPSGEVKEELPSGTLIPPTAGEVMDSCIGE